MATRARPIPKRTLAGLVASCGVATLACAPTHPGAHRTEDGDAGVGRDGGAQPADASVTIDGGLDGGGIPHRAEAAACDNDRPSVVPDGGFGRSIPDGGGANGYCNADADCQRGDAGPDGRCTVSPSFPEPLCTYDRCFADSDCGDAGVCACRDPDWALANVCVPSNCRVDAACGPGGYCSPTRGGCGPFTGVVGYYCHTPNDQCMTDSDCVSSYCVYDSATARWTCGMLDCSG